MRTALFLGGLSFLLAVVWGSPLIKLLKHYGVGKKIRIEGPAMHQVKAGTPTMGGLMIAVPVLINVGVVLACLPTKGLALPFISYGGTSLVFNFLAIGILLNISKYQQRI